jgi:hypothetical protein
VETAEYLLSLSRKAEEQAQELRATLTKIIDINVRGGGRNLRAELADAGLSHDAAWSTCNRVIEQRREAYDLCGRMQAEVELLTSIADDAIGTNGRMA